MLTPHQALEKYFGFSTFRDGQEVAIQRTLEDKHTLLVMPTGSGKSLAYQLPAMLKPGLTLVISPLIALMKDQVDSLVEAGLPATFINSSLSTQETNRRIRAVLEGDIKLLYIAPERLRSRQFTQAISKTKISLLAIDEAHCISQWGHDFRPDYLLIGPTWQAMGEPTLLATTATATPLVQKDILTLLQAKQAKTIVLGFNRPNLTFEVKHTPDDRTKIRTLQSIIQPIDGNIIIYVATRRNADDVADFVQDTMGIPAHSYHAGLDREWRIQVQNKFMTDRIRVVVATNAFGMGVDKPDVRAVIHYNLPSTVEAYYQEAGRAGRDGLPAQCTLLFAPDDQRLQEWMINSDTPAYEDLYQVYILLASAANDEEVYMTAQELAHSSGLHPVKLRVTLSELEQASLIYHMGNEGYHDHWKILPLSQEALENQAIIIEQRSERRHELLTQMLNYAHLTTCRRHFMLSYFGDTSTPDAPNCCDNHTTNDISTLPKAITPQEWYPLIVLDTVRSLEQRPVGRNRLAEILSGSRAKGIHKFGYDKHRFYAKLAHFSKKQVIQLIDGLIENRYLLIEGGKLPILRTTPSGTQALEARAALPIPMPNIAYDQKPRSERSVTGKQTAGVPKAELTPAQTEKVILEAIAKLGGTLGRSGLAKFLTGSRVSWLEAFSSHTYYGCLPDLSQRAVMDIIDALITDGKLIILGGHRPKVALPDQTIATKVADIQDTTDQNAQIAPVPTSVQNNQANAELAPETQAYLEKLRLWRTNQAKSQGMPPYIIFSNKVLEAIAIQSPQTISDLSKISGVGPAKLEKYGEAVIELITNNSETKVGGNSSQIQIPETPATLSTPSQQTSTSDSARVLSPEQETTIKTPIDIIKGVLNELDGLITLPVLAKLLTAKPDDIVPFSDNEFRSAFYGNFDYAEVEEQIQQAINTGVILLNSRGKLVLKKRV